MKSYNNIKSFFNYIINQKYEIIKDPNSNEIMKIIYDNNEIKCKYILLFSIETSNKNKEKNNNIIWSNYNQYIDQKTREISLFVKNSLELKKKYNWDNITKKELLTIINTIIKDNLIINYENENIYPMWIITGNITNFIQYYMITDIVYY